LSLREKQNESRRKLKSNLLTMLILKVLSIFTLLTYYGLWHWEHMELAICFRWNFAQMKKWNRNFFFHIPCFFWTLEKNWIMFTTFTPWFWFDSIYYYYYYFFILKMYKLLPFNARSLLECHTIVFMKYVPRGFFFNLQNKQVK